MATVIKLSAIESRLRNATGLVVGPSVTCNLDPYEQAFAQLEQQPELKLSENDNFYKRTQELLDSGSIMRLQMQELVQRKFSQAGANLCLNQLVKGRWLAVASLTPDNNFYRSLQTELDSRPISEHAVLLASPQMVPPQSSIPVLQLLGDPMNADRLCRAAVTYSDYLERRRKWRDMIQQLPDYLHGAPLFFAGTGKIGAMVEDFINELLAVPPAAPAELIFLADDPTPNSDTFRALVEGRCGVLQVECSLSEFCKACAPTPLAHDSGRVPEVSPEARFDPNPLLDVVDQIEFIPETIPHVVTENNINRLLDILFSSSVASDWTPYQSNLDFSREVTDLVKQKISCILNRDGSDEPRCIVVRGEAGVGKTVLLNRVGYDLSQEGLLVLYIRKAFGAIGRSRLDKVVTCINRSLKGRATEVVIIYDDPVAGRMRPIELIDAMSKLDKSYVVIFGIRNSDILDLEDGGLDVSGGEFEIVELDSVFTQDEAKDFPNYLENIGVVNSPEDGRELIRKITCAGGGQEHFPDSIYASPTEDLLCSLWYLIPSTRHALKESLTDEYIRLGGLAGALREFAEGAFDGKQIARRAYELVAACSGLGVLVPVEVLVSALKISFAEWLNCCKEGTPLWGLIYDEEYLDGQGWAYRTRNKIVTDVLLKLLNGGVSHAGEFRCLRDLLSACRSSTPVYREFICDVLVRRRKLLSKRFTFEEGFELFDSALQAFPVEDRTIEHHRGLWVGENGGDSMRAHKALERALTKRVYPEAQQQEPKEHIHTSIAANSLRAVGRGDIAPEAGFDLVHKHVSLASNPRLFDPHSLHIQAATLIRMARLFYNKDAAKFFECLEEAGSISARAAILIKPNVGKVPDAAKSMTKFEDLQEEISIAMETTSDLVNAAEILFESTRDQNGFVVAGRALHRDAERSGKGRDWKRCQDFLNRAIRTVEDAGEEVSPKIRLVRANMFICWRVLAGKEAIPWEIIRDDLKVCVSTFVGAGDPLWMFFLAVAYCHLNDFAGGEAIFSELGRQHLSNYNLRRMRCFMLDMNGNRRTFTGIVRAGAGGRKFVDCSEFPNDLHCAVGEFKAPEGATVLFNVGFAFFGMRAVRAGGLKSEKLQ